jgi:threonine aldolase
MANQIGMQLHCRPGDEVIVGEGSHSSWYEAGGPAALAGVSLVTVGRGGLYSAADVESAIKPSEPGLSATRLVLVENTHNRGGGVVWDVASLAAVVETARARGLALHLDGARLLNAAHATGKPAASLAAPFDTATLCFSKGLGAPVGSVIAGSREHRTRSRHLRRRLGGGMRQAGVLAAAALYALDNNVERLVEDHDHARLLADGLATVPGVSVDRHAVQTNIVMIDLQPSMPEAAAMVARFRERGVLASAFGPRRIRLVTHLDVGRDDCRRALALIQAALTSTQG